MTIPNVEQIEALEKACSKLLETDKIRHVAVINKLGKAIASKSKPGIEIFLNDEKVKMVYMQLMLDLKMRQELDEILGPIDYITARRKNITIISVPTENYLVVISAERDVISADVIKKAEEIFDIIDFKRN